MPVPIPRSSRTRPARTRSATGAGVARTVSAARRYARAVYGLASARSRRTANASSRSAIVRLSGPGTAGYSLAVVTIVVPYSGSAGKTRLFVLGDEPRARIVLAMLEDVLAACTCVGVVRVVTADPAGADAARALGAEVVPDPGGGQGAAVQAALDGLPPDPVLVVNADVPCVVPHDLRALLRAAPAGGVALAEAADGTTNALALPSPGTFTLAYGPGSAARFRAHARRLGLELVSAAIPNLGADVDTVADLHRLQFRVGPRTQAALHGLTEAA
jgi:2-phospho-L-lactate/phosphoenolpyruvate guanylyltransferase